MRRFIALFLLLWPSLAVSGVINVEFKFTPFVGEPAKADSVETVPGKASVYINNVPIADQEVDKREVPVLFQEREIAPSVWLPVDSHGPLLRKGKNMVRIEFEPADPKTRYRAQLRWASVTDRTMKTEDGPGRVSETNQSGEGMEEKQGAGRMVFEREFAADFATDLPWHHFPAIKSLSDNDRKELARLVKERVELFRPDFGQAYRILANNRSIDMAGIKKARCLDKGYSAGIRIVAQPQDKIDFILTGNPEVVVQGKSGNLFLPRDLNALERIKDDDMQMCVIMVLSTLYPPRLTAVRSAAGKWEVVN